MVSSLLRQVSVWLDELVPDQGAFPHALEWASRLRLPLHGIAWAAPGMPALAERLPRPAASCPSPPRGMHVAFEAYALACSAKRVPWDLSTWQGPFTSGVQEFLRSAELCVFGNALPPAVKDELLRRSLRAPLASVLVCPRSWQPVGRALVLQEHRQPGSRFLDAVVEVCRAFEVAPAVLTLAPSEAEARRRQKFAEQVLAGHRLPADFDFAAGSDPVRAVPLVARCRRCTHAIVERRSSSPWWRWLWGDTFTRLLGIADSLTVLALPESSQDLQRAGRKCG
jgi:hypothetical protein